MTLAQLIKETGAYHNASSSGCVVVQIGLVPQSAQHLFFHLDDYAVSSQGSQQYFMVPRCPTTLAEATTGPNTLGHVADKPLSEVSNTNWRARVKE